MSFFHHPHGHKGPGVLQAIYGAHIIDIRRHLSPGQHYLVATQHGDPAPGQRKQLLLTYAENGRLQTIVVEEGQHVHIPHHPIVMALFGLISMTRDVTYQVIDNINHHHHFRVENHVFQQDPAPGVPKRLFLAISKSKTVHVHEGEVVRIKPTAVVTRVVYHDRDVTSHVWNHLEHHHQHGLHISNDSMGCDPAPGHRKQAFVTVVYAKMHKVHIHEVPEHGELHI